MSATATLQTIEFMKTLRALNQAIDVRDTLQASSLHWDILVAMCNIDLQEDSMPEFDFVCSDGRSLLEHSVMACERAAMNGIIPVYRLNNVWTEPISSGEWSRRTSHILAGAGMDGWAIDRIVQAFSTYGLIDIQRSDLEMHSATTKMCAVDMAIAGNYGLAAAAFIKAGASLEDIPNRPIRIQVGDKTTVDIRPGDLGPYLDLMITDQEDLEVLVEAIRARRASDSAAAMNEQIEKARRGDGSASDPGPAPRRRSL